MVNKKGSRNASFFVDFRKEKRIIMGSYYSWLFFKK